MKTMNIKSVALLCMLMPAFAMANPFLNETKKDTVVIELENGSKIVIYTKNKEELKKLTAYDINRMVKDLNRSVQSSDKEFMEINMDDGKKYILDSPTVLFGDRMSIGDTVYIDEEDVDNIRIRVGGMELYLDPDELEDLGRDEFEAKKYSYVKDDNWKTRNYFTMDLGVNNWLIDGSEFPSASDEAYAVKPWGSWYVGLNINNQTRIGGPLVLEWGGGLSWYNFKLEDADFLVEKGDTQIEFNDIGAERAGLKSKLTVGYINASVVPMLDFGKGSRKVKTYSSDGFYFSRSKRRGFRIGAGGYIGYRIGSSSKLIYKEDGNQDRIKERDHFFLENFRYGIRGQLGFGSFDMFVMYDLNTVFAPGRGPAGNDLNAFTVGIIL